MTRAFSSSERESEGVVFAVGVEDEENCPFVEEEAFGAVEGGKTGAVVEAEDGRSEVEVFVDSKSLRMAEIRFSISAK